MIPQEACKGEDRSLDAPWRLAEKRRSPECAVVLPGVAGRAQLYEHSGRQYHHVTLVWLRAAERGRTPGNALGTQNLYLSGVNMPQPGDKIFRRDVDQWLQVGAHTAPR